MINKFLNKEVAIHIRSSYEYNELMLWCESRGIRWIDGTLATSFPFNYTGSKEKTCIVCEDNKIAYMNIDSCNKATITYDEMISNIATINPGDVVDMECLSQTTRRGMVVRIGSKLNVVSENGLIYDLNSNNVKAVYKIKSVGPHLSRLFDDANLELVNKVENKFKVGDIVETPIGIGVIVGKSTPGPYAVRFDHVVECWHTCDGLCKSGWGRYFSEDRLKLATLDIKIEFNGDIVTAKWGRYEASVIDKPRKEALSCAIEELQEIIRGDI